MSFDSTGFHNSVLEAGGSWTISPTMAYSIHGHISYILESNSKRPDDFS